MAGSFVVGGVIDVSNWPHDVMHDLSASVDRAAAEIAACLESDPDHHSLADVTRAAQVQVRGAIIRHHDDIVDVLTQCVTRTVPECCEEPKLSDSGTASRGSCADSAVFIAASVSQVSTGNTGAGAGLSTVRCLRQQTRGFSVAARGCA